MGCNRLGDPGVDPAYWPPLVKRAMELGVNLFDTANSYNQGKSETILGEATLDGPQPIYLATKVGASLAAGARWEDREFSAQTILREVENSLKRLQRDTIDLYMLHGPSLEQLENGDWAPAIQKLKDQGKIRFFGVSAEDHPSGIWALLHGADFLEIEYHLLDPTAEDDLLPLAKRFDIGIMVRMPLARGLLSGKFPAGQPLPPEQQWRRPKGAQLQRRLQRTEQLRFLEREGQTLSQAAIRYVLSHPAVHCAIPGARTIAQLEENVAAADADLTTAEIAHVHALQDQWRQSGEW